MLAQFEMYLMEHFVQDLPEHGLVLREQFAVLDSLEGLGDDVMLVFFRLGLFEVSG